MSQYSPEGLINSFGSEIQSNWRQHRKQIFNQNTKGAAYERTLSDFLGDYFGHLYNIYTRTAVIDKRLTCFDVFNAGESEIDVVSTYTQAVPGIIFESSEMRWVPYDAVAFVCEVKSKITTSSLESDLLKFAKLKNIEPDDQSNRFRGIQSTTDLFIESEPGNRIRSVEATVGHQLKCLVYDEASISEESLRELLREDTEIWDILLIVDKNIIFLSPELPFTDFWNERFTFSTEEEDIPLSEALPEILCLQDGLLWFILVLALSIPRTLPFDASMALLRMATRDWKEEGNYLGFGQLEPSE